MGSCKSKANQPEKVKNTSAPHDKRRQKQGTQTQSQIKAIPDVTLSEVSERQKLLEKVNDKVIKESPKSQNEVKKAVPEQEKLKAEKPATIAESSLEDNKMKESVSVNEKFRLSTITPLEQMTILKDMFGEFDTNGDKRISREEFLERWKTNSIDDLEGGKVFQDIDCNSSGFISLSEFTSWYLSKAMKALVGDFKKMGKRKSAKISKKDFVEACKSNVLFPVSEAEELFMKFDKNGDGKLTFKEFRDAAEQHYIAKTLQES